MARRRLPGKQKVERLSQQDAKKLAARLRDEIRHHDYRYYVENRPEIPDREYDRLFDTLKQVEETFPKLVTPGSPTQRVGAEPLDAFRTVKHVAPC